MTLTEFIIHALDEDIRDGDHSSLACIPAAARGRAILRIKESGILAGVDVAEAIFRQVEPGMSFTPILQNGDRIQPGETAFEVEASVHTLLKTERLVLNIMQRMSGIATLTRQYVDRVRQYPVRILDTRKTTPNFRWFEKEAVRIGGGHNHRMGLYDMIMLKDNHIDFCGGIEAALDKTRAYLRDKQLDLQVEVETRNLDDVATVLRHGGADRIMFDNFTPALIREALLLTQGKVETEASGGINLDNLEAYAETGVDFISIGAMIHHAVSLDLSLKALI